MYINFYNYAIRYTSSIYKDFTCLERSAFHVKEKEQFLFFLSERLSLMECKSFYTFSAKKNNRKDAIFDVFHA